MYDDIAGYFKRAYSGRCEIYINPRRLLRKIPKLPDLLIVPTREADELVTVEAKSEAVASTFSQALGRGIELKEFSTEVHVAFNEPIPARFQRDLNTIAPKIGLLSRASDGHVSQLRPAKKEMPRRPEVAKELKFFLLHYSLYLLAEKKARIEGSKHFDSVLKMYREVIEDEKT